MKILIFVVLVLIVWSVWGYFASRAEQAVYSVLEKRDGYEIREYAPQILAQTMVSGDYNQGMNTSFRVVAGYIFGNNTKKETIAMTVPVVMKDAVPGTIGSAGAEVKNGQTEKSEQIAMTVPVLTASSDGVKTMSFVMPRSYTLGSLPTPNDSKVKLVEVPKAKKAALGFSWYRTEERVENKKIELQALLARDGLKATSTPEFAAYNGPGTPPWMNRHEILITLE